MDFEKLAREIFNHKLNGTLSASLLSFYADKLLKGIYKGYDSNLDNRKLEPKNKNILEALAGNIYQFSGAKTWHELFEYNQLLRDDKNQLRSWNEFYKEAQQIHKTYSVHYLQTEYQFAVNTSLMIKRWNEFWDERETLPYLKYDAILDDRTRDSHAQLSGIVRPITDPFWDTHYPPLGWNCRCEVLQSGMATESELSKSIPEIDIPKPFRNNPAKDKKVFSEEMPYFKHLPEEARKQISFTNLSLLIDSPLLKKLAQYEKKQAKRKSE